MKRLTKRWGEDGREGGQHMSENKKPRIAEILGVEVGERFSLMGFQPHYVEFWIKSDGTFETNPPRVPNSSVALLRAVEQPCFVIRKPRRPRWTEQDKEDAKAVRHLMPWATKVGRGRDYDSLMLNSSVGLHRDLFPSLKPGVTVTLDEIIGGGE